MFTSLFPPCLRFDWSSFDGIIVLLLHLFLQLQFNNTRVLITYSKICQPHYDERVGFAKSNRNTVHKVNVCHNYVRILSEIVAENDQKSTIRLLIEIICMASHHQLEFDELGPGDKQLLASQMCSDIHIIAVLTVVHPVIMYLVFSNCGTVVPGLVTLTLLKCP